MKKTDRIARDLEQSVNTGVENAKDWAAPRVEAAVHWAVPRLQQGLDTAAPKIHGGIKAAANNLADGVATVTPKLQDGLAQLAPKIHDAVEGATPRLHEALDRATPAIGHARDRVVVEYLPRLSDQIGVASDAVYRKLESAPVRVDAVAQKFVDSGFVHSIQDQAKDAGGHLKSVANEAGKVVGIELVRPRKRKHRGLLIFGVIAAAAAAGVAAWKASKPVEDPWKTPSPVTPAPVSATTVNEAQDALADAAEKSGDTAVAAADSAADSSAKVSDSVADAAETAKDAAEDAAETAKDAAEDASEAASKVATDAKTAVRNIAANMSNDADKNGK